MTRVAWLFFFLGSSLAVSQTAGHELRVKRIVSVEYPRVARLAYVQGNVELIASISQDGSVLGIRSVSGSPFLVPATRNGLSKWLFTGCSTGSVCEIKIVFSFAILEGACEYSPSSQFEADLPDHVTIKSKPICGNRD
jgi:hypothetical protein